MRQVLLTIIGLLFISSSAFTMESISEFEKENQAEEQSCNQELFSCSVRFQYAGNMYTAAEEGSNRAIALTGLLKVCRSYTSIYAANDCLQAIRNQRAVCIKL